MPKCATTTTPATLYRSSEAAGGSRKLPEASACGALLAPALPSSCLPTPAGDRWGTICAESAASAGDREGSVPLGRPPETPGRFSEGEKPQRAPRSARGSRGFAPEGRLPETPGEGSERAPGSAGRGSRGFAPAWRLPEGSRGVLGTEGPERAPRTAGRGRFEGFVPAEQQPEGSQGFSGGGGLKRAPPAAGSGPRGTKPSELLLEGSWGMSVGVGPERAVSAAGKGVEGFAPVERLPEGSQGVLGGEGTARAPHAAGRGLEGSATAGWWPEGSQGVSVPGPSPERTPHTAERVLGGSALSLEGSGGLVGGVWFPGWEGPESAPSAADWGPGGSSAAGRQLEESGGVLGGAFGGSGSAPPGMGAAEARPLPVSGMNRTSGTPEIFEHNGVSRWGNETFGSVPKTSSHLVSASQVHPFSTCSGLVSRMYSGMRMFFAYGLRNCLDLEARIRVKHNTFIFCCLCYFPWNVRL